MMLLDDITLVLTILLRVFSVYFVLIALFCLRRPKPIPRHDPQTRFACLIAARNEEAVIGQLVESLLAQNYPQGLRDVYVIPNNCTDWTEARAREAGAKIFRCFEPVTRKGDALHEAVAWLLPQGYDAFCVFDADNLADPDFLARMNDAFCAGARVTKAALKTKNPGDSWVAGCYGLYFTMFDRFFNRARANCGLSAKLVGTGLAVHRTLLEEMGGWNTETIAEDAEFSAQCAARGERVWFVPQAVTYDEAPLKFSVSLRQRRRWCSGIMTVAEQFWGYLIPALRRPGGLRALDSLVFFASPFVQAVSLLPLLLNAISAALQGNLAQFALILGVGAAAAWVGVTLMGALLARLGGYGRAVTRSVLLFPVFMASWIPLQTLSLLRRTKDWKAISHTRTVSARELSRSSRSY